MEIEQVFKYTRDSLTGYFEKCLEVFGMHFSNTPTNYEMISNQTSITREFRYRDVTTIRN